jgi:catechol 2,3-dioxygenase-like lactoylglutathione lyase family enzyme
MALGNLDVFHVGIVVDDLDAAMGTLGGTLGLTWAPVQQREQVVRTGDGDVRSDEIRFTYSAEGVPHLELIESATRRVWQPGPPGQLHHVGAFATDVAAASRRLAADGAPLEFGGGDGDEPAGFAYHLAPGGLRVELVEAARREQFARWMAGGRLDGRPAR